MHQQNLNGNTSHSVKILDISQVSELTTLSKSTLYRMIKRGKFPRPVSLSTNRSGFVAGEIEDWICSRARNTTLKAATNSTSMNPANQHTKPNHTNSTSMNPANHTNQYNGCIS